MNTNDLLALRHALHEGAFLLRAPELGTLAITGKDRQTWLNGMVTCDLGPRRAGEAAYGFAVAKNGKILGELRILIDDERILISVRRERIDELMQHFDRYVIMEDVTIEDISNEVSWVLAHGPCASNLVAIARAHGAIGAGSVDMSGKGGALLALEPNHADEVIERLLKEKRSGVALGDDAAWNILRVEVGIGEWGVDFGTENYPQEASLENLAVSFQKGCYLGQEAVFMLQMRGHVKKRIVKLNVDGQDDLAPNAEITSADGSSVGSVTSWAKGSEKEHVVALGYVKWKLSQSGTELRVSGRNAIVT